MWVGKRGIRDDPARPNICEEIILADDAFAVSQKVGQQIENQRSDRNGRIAATQLPRVASSVYSPK